MVVVADTSVLLNICRIRQEQLLPALFHEVWIPLAVRDEFNRHAQTTARFRGLILPGWIKVSAPLTIAAEVTACPDLDAGESEALTLSLQMRAAAILIDESAARSAAIRLGVPFIGVVGILLQAKQQGLILVVRPLLDQLEQDAGFWLRRSFREHVLRLAGE
jgi:hypothetical protein